MRHRTVTCPGQVTGNQSNGGTSRGICDVRILGVRMVEGQFSRSHPCRTSSWGGPSDQPARLHFLRSNVRKPTIQPVYSEILLYSTLENRTLLCSARLLARKIHQYSKMAPVSPTRIKNFSNIKKCLKSGSKNVKKQKSLVFWHHKLKGFLLKP